jgi:hypothetical protein
VAGAAALACYLATLAPDVTFWDAGEFIAAAQGLGIPHPPGTPLYVAIGRLAMLSLGALVGRAVAMNLLSALATASAVGLTAWLIARETGPRADAAWGALAATLCAGLMASVWANATETEVYAVALALAAVMLVCAARSNDGEPRRDARWLMCTAYAIALAPAVHLSALVAVPAAIMLAARKRDGSWCLDRLLLLGGSLVIAAGVGRMSPTLVAVGVAIGLASLPFRRGAGEWRPRMAALFAGTLLLAALGASALLVMLVRARHDPAMNQGDPATLGALADLVARRQYDVAPLLPRRAPVWLQLANVAQYADWQAALGWGHGIFTTPARVTATVLFVALMVIGARAMRRDARRIADALMVLLVCGTLGVAAYLNLRAGASLGWGMLSDPAMHEARERDYFFVLGFWAWGCLAGYGALALTRSRRWPPWTALAVVLVPLAGNWSASDRRREPEASAARRVATELLGSAPRGAVLFLAGDNDSYPLWFAQQVEGERRDVTLVTIPLLSADWYATEVSRRTGLRWPPDSVVRGTRWKHEQRAALIAGAARQAGRPVAASPLVTARERTLLGADWALHGVIYLARSARPSRGRRRAVPAGIDTAATAAWASRVPADARAREGDVDGAPRQMLQLLDCPRLALPWTEAPARRDSLEVSCNFR